ncbi:hypothetical protein APHAL10511_005376 [Amanita phalloides]|nr:hypothetical protein APHAL10511_005376 [Amanita phalloides]
MDETDDKLTFPDPPDDALLASLGYKQEFKRNFTPIEVFGIGFSVIGLMPSISSVLVYSIPYGGPSAMIWGWSTSGVFLMCIALSLAELGSAAPTSGGLYFWTFIFSSPRWRHFLAWIVAYCNTIGNIAALASVDWDAPPHLPRPFPFTALFFSGSISPSTSLYPWPSLSQCRWPHPKISGTALTMPLVTLPTSRIDQTGLPSFSVLYPLFGLSVHWTRWSTSAKKPRTPTPPSLMELRLPCFRASSSVGASMLSLLFAWEAICKIS